MEWISVKDRLPEDGQEVLAYWGDWNTVIDTYSGVEWIKGKSFGAFTTHWMPLPNPPKGE